jgi:hypothetical protein
MPDACKNHYEQLQAKSVLVLAASFEPGRAELMAKAHAFVADIDLWLAEFLARPELPVLQACAREYQFALFALTQGQYRAAFVALRLSLELALAGVQWSANERELRQWSRGQRDLAWAALIDPENGVLSKTFVSLFTEALVDETPNYRGSAATVYRECSEYVHGNAHTHRTLPAQILFDLLAFDTWHSKASVVRLVISFVLAARYLGDFDAPARSRLEASLLDHLGHSKGVRALLGAPLEPAYV